MIQTGDPTNTGNGGESIYSEDFRDEFHSRLKFSHRGIVAMANKDKPNTNGSQFFITLDKCQEMDKKFTIFGKVTGPTFFNALNISNLSADESGYPIMNDDEKPKILNTLVVINPFNNLKPTVVFENDKTDKGKNNKIEKKLKIKYASDKIFFKNENNEEKKNKIENEKKEADENEFKDLKENNDEKNINFFKEDDKNNEDDKNDEDKNKDKTEDKDLINKQNVKNVENEDEIEEDSNEEKDNNEKEENNDENHENENDEDSESKSLSSENHIVQNAKQMLDDDEDNIPKNKKKNIHDYKKEINLLRKKVKREKEEKLNDDNIRKKIEEEKINKMNILQKYNYDYIKYNQANKLSTDERANKLKIFKSFIGGGDSTGWFKTKLKFQTDSQKAFTLDMINKELEKNEY